MTGETNYDSIFGKMAVEQGFCTDEELQQSIKELEARRNTQPIMLSELMIDLGFVTASQADRLKSKIRESKAVTEQLPGYQIIGKLGRGAMAVVYKARQVRLDSIVAIQI